YESHVLQARLARLPATLDTLLLDAGYDDGDLIDAAAQRNLLVLAPLAKAIGESTPQARRDRTAYLAIPIGKTRYALRGTSIEPFFGTIKALFGLNPLPR